MTKTTLQKGHYIAGFVDGEGSFMVVLRKREDYSLQYKVSVCFNVSQKERYILSHIKNHLGCGTIRTRPDGVSYLEVNTFAHIVKYIIPFFQKYPFLSHNKKKQFSLFCQVVRLMQQSEHHTESGLRRIIQLRHGMNRGGASSRKNEIGQKIPRDFTRDA